LTSTSIGNGATYDRMSGFAKMKIRTLTPAWGWKRDAMNFPHSTSKCVVCNST